jgi:hypothetical protein
MAKLKVKAREKGYYGFMIRNEGESFSISKPEDFSHRWMIAVGWKPPTRKKMAAAAGADEGEPDVLTFRGAKDAYEKDGIEIAMEEAVNRAIDDADMSVTEWNDQPEKSRKDKIMAAVKIMMEEEAELRDEDPDTESDDDDVEEDESEEDDEE